MRRAFFLTIVFLLLVESAMSQEDLIPPKRSRTAKVGFFGGLTPGWLFVDVDPLNEFLVAANGAPLKDNGVFLFGGGGAVYIGVINNFRIGGVGMSGSISSSLVDASGVRRDADLSVGFGGVTVEYVIPVAERLVIAVGTMLGWGGVDLTLREDNGENLTWDDEWADFGSGNYNNPSTGLISNITRKLTGSYVVWVPSLNVEYAVLGLLGARVGVSYVGMNAPSWTVDGEYDLTGAPGDVNGRGFMINAGLFIGAF